MGDVLKLNKRAAYWGEKPKTRKGEMSASELEHEYRKASIVLLQVQAVERALRKVVLELHGPIAAVPPLKNSRVINPKTGRSFPNKHFTSKVRAMDRLFDDALTGRELPSFGCNWVHMLLICGERSQDFDLVGAVETIQDWLEPKHKTHARTPRGWGIGLIADDHYLIPQAFHSWQIGPVTKHTTIILRPWEHCREELIAGAAKAFL